jgi:TolB-like protein
LKNLSGRPDEAWLSTALSEMLATELAAGEQMRAVPGEKVAQAKIDLGLVAADGYSAETLARIRANLGSDVVVLGSYTALGQKSNGRIRVDLRLQEAATGETIAEVATTGSETELFDLVTRAGLQLREKLGVEAVSADQAAGVRASAPANSEAARLYAEGLGKLRVFDALAARDLLVKAVAVEPGYPGRPLATMEGPRRNLHWLLSCRENYPVKTDCQLRANTGKRRSNGTKRLAFIRVSSLSSLTAWTMG